MKNMVYIFVILMCVLNTNAEISQAQTQIVQDMRNKIKDHSIFDNRKSSKQNISREQYLIEQSILQIPQSDKSQLNNQNAVIQDSTYLHELNGQSSINLDDEKINNFLKQVNLFSNQSFKLSKVEQRMREESFKHLVEQSKEWRAYREEVTSLFENTLSQFRNSSQIKSQQPGKKTFSFQNKKEIRDSIEVLKEAEIKLQLKIQNDIDNYMQREQRISSYVKRTFDWVPSQKMDLISTNQEVQSNQNILGDRYQSQFLDQKPEKMSLFETIMLCEFFVFTVVGVAYAFMFSPSYLKKGDPFKRDM